MATILIVEDNVELNRLVARQLEGEGYVTLSAYGGREGLDQAQRRQGRVAGLARGVETDHAVLEPAGAPRHIIRTIRLAHCKRGPDVCAKCRELDVAMVCLLDLYAAGDGPKNTARWVITIPKAVYQNSRWVDTASPPNYFDPLGTRFFTTRRQDIETNFHIVVFALGVCEFGAMHMSGSLHQ